MSLEPLSVTMAMFLKRMPLLPTRSTVTGMVPEAPAGTVHGNPGNSAVVQPQPGVTRRRVTLADEMLVNTNVKRAFSSLAGTLVVASGMFQARTPSGNGWFARVVSGT